MDPIIIVTHAGLGIIEMVLEAIGDPSTSLVWLGPIRDHFNHVDGERLFGNDILIHRLASRRPCYAGGRLPKITWTDTSSVAAGG